MEKCACLLNRIRYKFRYFIPIATGYQLGNQYDAMWRL